MSSSPGVSRSRRWTGAYCAIHQRLPQFRTVEGVFTWIDDCAGCHGTGQCDLCHGHGCHDCDDMRCGQSHECGACEGSGDCPDCDGNQLSESLTTEDRAYLAWCFTPALTPTLDVETLWPM